MIASIYGEVLLIEASSLVMSVGGVGLRVFVPAGFLASVQIGQKVFLHTHLIVREDALTLFGFETQEEQTFFELLLSVNGVGPRTALAMLSALTVDAIRRAILSEQPDILARVSGVGKKTAQKILITLQGKVGTRPEGLELGGESVDQEVLDALTGLGYSIIEAQAAIQSLGRDAPKDVEERLRLALQFFSN